MPRFQFTANLKRFYPDLQPIEVNAKSVQEALEKINKIHPGIKDYIVEENGKLRKHVNIFIGNSMILDKDSLSDKLRETDDVYIMQALSGG